MTGHGSPSETVFATARAERSRRIAGSRVRAGIAAFLILVTCEFGLLSAIAQVPQLQEPTRLRITWGGGAASQWTGRIVLDKGMLSDLNVAELNADSAGSVWLEDRHVAVGSLSARKSEAIEASAQAEQSAQLIVELLPALESTPVRAQVSLAELTRGPYQLKLDDTGNTLIVERVANQVAIFTDRQPLIFSPGEPFAFDARIMLENAEPGTTLDVHTKLVSSNGEILWPDEQRVAVPVDGPLTLSLNPQMPQAEGAYTIRITATRPPGFRPGFLLPGGAAPLAERSFEFVVIDSNKRDTVRAATWGSVLEIDPTNPRWWDRLPNWTQLRRIPGLNHGPLGSSRAASINHPLGRFIELPPTPEGGEPHWQAYSLPLEAAGVPHMLEIDFPADKEQRFGLALVEPNSSGVVEEVVRDTGVYVEGLGLSEANQKQTHRVIFWPRTQVPLLLVTNQHPRATAHFGQIRVLKCANNRLSPGAASVIGNERLVAAYIAQPRFAQTFGIEQPNSHDRRATKQLQGGDWNNHYLCATRLADYLRYAGYNSAVITMQGDGKPFSATPSQPSTSQGDSLRADGLELLLRVFDREGLTLVPALNLATPLPELERLRRTTNSQTSGLEWVGPDGRTWLQTNSSRNGQAPYYNLLDPRVQQAIFRTIREFVERYGPHAALGGVALQLSSDGYAQLPTPEWGLDDATVARFENETSIQIRAAGPNRFAVRHAALNGPHAQAWRAWRAGQLTAFYRQLADLVRAGNDRRRLLLTAERSFDHPQINARVLPKILNDIQLDATLLDLGINRVALMQSPGITFCSTRYVAPAQPLPDRAVDLEVSDAFAALRRQATLPVSADSLPASAPLDAAPAALLYHRPQPLELSSIAIRSLAIANDFQLASQPLAHGPAIRQPYAVTLAEADSAVLLDGGEVLSLSGDTALRETRHILQHLPIGAQVAEVRQQPLIVRSYSESQRVTMLVINACPWHTQAQIALELPGIVTMKSLVESSEESASPANRSQILEPGGPPIIFSLEPFAVQAVQFDSGRLKVAGVTARLSETARLELSAALAELRERDPRALRVLNSIPNAGFEPVGGGALPGWRLVGSALGTAELDATNPHEGKTCLYVQSAGQPTAVESDAFSTPPTGQFAMTALIRGRNLASGSELRMVVEAERENRSYRWSTVVGGARPGAHPLGEQWAPYPILVNALPLQSRGQMRVRFELTGAGEVWIDEIRAYDLLFPLDFYRDAKAENWEFVQMMEAAEVDFKKGRITDCVRRLDGYWSRFYSAYTPLTQQRVPSQPSPQTALTSQPPLEPAPQSSPGLGERFRRLIPKFR